MRKDASGIAHEWCKHSRLVGHGDRAFINRRIRHAIKRLDLAEKVTGLVDSDVNRDARMVDRIEEGMDQCTTQEARR